MPNKPNPNSFASWMRHALPGESTWTEQSGPSVLTAAARFDKKVRLQTFIAVHPSTLAVMKLLRVTVRSE